MNESEINKKDENENETILKKSNPIENNIVNEEI